MGLISALRRLTLACNKPYADRAEQVDAIDHAHGLFHEAVVAACRSPRLLELQARYYQQAWRYRRRSLLLLTAAPMVDFVREHEELVQVLLERNPTSAVAALRNHLALTPRDFALEIASPRSVDQLPKASSNTSTQC